jgi:hypothetical protein
MRAYREILKKDHPGLEAPIPRHSDLPWYGVKLSDLRGSQLREWREFVRRECSICGHTTPGCRCQAAAERAVGEEQGLADDYFRAKLNDTIRRAAKDRAVTDQFWRDFMKGYTHEP